MSDMRKLLESINKFAGEPEQKPGDQVRGTDKPKKSEKKHAFGDRLVGEGVDEFAQELMLEYRMFVEQPVAGNVAPGNPTSPVANINPAGQGTGNVAVAGSTIPSASSAQVKTGAAPNQQPNPAQAAAMAAKDKLNLSTNLNQLKTLDPALNVAKATAALQKDPNKTNASDAAALGQLANTLEPVLKDKQAIANLKSQAQRLTPR